MHRGYVKLYRKSEENPLYFAETFTKWQAWSDLILIANHSQKTLSIRGNLIKINRGQTAYSEESLSRRWKWSRNKVRRFINYLKTEQQIEQQQSNMLNILTIKNYNIYHGNGTTDDTTERQQTIQQTDTNNNNKNNKNDKKLYMECVYLSDEEYQKLLSQYKEAGTKQRIENLNLYIMSKGKKYKSHYHTILSWDRKNNKQDKQSPADITKENLKQFMEEMTNG